MQPRILLKGKSARDKDLRSHHPVCPSCGNKEYKKLSVCHQCNNIVCEKCKGVHP